MPRFDGPPRFFDDLAPHSAGPGSGTVGRMRIQTADPEGEYSPACRRVPIDQRPPATLNETASQHARTLAAMPDTRAMVEAARVEATEGGKPYQRTEETLAAEASYTITRSSDGTIRCDLHTPTPQKPAVLALVPNNNTTTETTEKDTHP